MTAPWPHGFLVVDKPGGITSRRAVDMVQKWFPRGTRIGHAGTLDPLATGVLVMALGKATRLIEYVQRMEKEYHAVITLGAVSDTDDAQGTIKPISGAHPPVREKIEDALRCFVGEIDQVPPAFSAAHVEGRRAHQLARRGKEVELAPRKVSIREIRVVSHAYPNLEVVVRCGKGTYIRSIARDLGERLGCGGYIAALRRTRIGLFRLPALELHRTAPQEAPDLQPLASGVGDLRCSRLEATSIQALEHGRPLKTLADISGGEEEVAILDAAGRLRAIVSWDAEKGAWRAGKVFKAAS